MPNPKRVVEAFESGLAKERIALRESHLSRREYLGEMLAKDAGFEINDFVRYDEELFRVTGFILAKEHKNGICLKITNYFDDRQWIAYPEQVTKV